MEKIERKFIDIVDVEDYEIETDEGWVDIKNITKTVPYLTYYIKTNGNKELWCADNHILFDNNMNEKFAKNFEIGDKIMTIDGVETIVIVNNLNVDNNMYDLVLSENSNHRYYSNGILSHNTFIGKKLAEQLFGDENKIVRFDLSEYTDKTAVGKLIGSNPGYIGYEKGGLLTEAIKNKKHCVLLLDEIEKADTEIYNLFLQVLDEGFLTDNTGMKIDFKNVIIIATSNVGAKTASSLGKGIGFNEDEEKNQRNILTKELKKKFPPEFLNRFNDIIYFNPLNDDNLRQIINNRLTEVKNTLSRRGLKFTYYDCVVDYLMKIIEPDREYGARPIARAIETEILDRITQKILDMDEPISEFIFTVDFDDKLEIRATGIEDSISVHIKPDDEEEN